MPLLLDKVVPWGRSFDEYQQMFALSDDEVRGRILVCGDGPASFNAEMRKRGHHCLSVDPIYQFSTDEIRQQFEASYSNLIVSTTQTADSFVWKRFSSPDDLGVARRTVVQRFLTDFQQNGTHGRYIAGELPNLPFADQQFDLALCSHYLFCYSNLVDADAHLSAIREMCRVAAEARIFPLLGMFDSGCSPHLDPVCEQLQAEGYSVEIRAVPYEFLKGANQMLSVRR